MKQLLLILILLFSLSLQGIELLAQQRQVVGSSICSDGNQTTPISVSAPDPQKIYSLFLDGKFRQARYPDEKEVSGPIDFGSVKEFGTYTVVEFSKTVKPDRPETGKSIKGSVSIFHEPKVIAPEKLKIKSGAPVNFQPHSDITGCTFRWKAKLESGKAIGFHKMGEGIIHDTITLMEKDPAGVIYTITPYSPENMGACMGQPVELRVLITK